MKSIRTRKDELLELIKAKKNEPVVVEDLYNDFRKILWSNGIKNEELISAQLNRMIAENLPKAAVYSNLKFMHLFRSRLTEEGVSLADAELIMKFVNFNMDEINEDDDYIGDVALSYAELCALWYGGLTAGGKTFTEDMAKKCNFLKLKLPPA